MTLGTAEEWSGTPLVAGLSPAAAHCAELRSFRRGCMAQRSLVYGVCDCRVFYIAISSLRRMRLQSILRVLVQGVCDCRVFYKKFKQKLTDTEVFLHVVLSNFSVFAARGVPPDPHGDVKGSVKKIKTRIFKNMYLFIDFVTTLGGLPGAILATIRQLFLKKLIRARI